MRSDRLLATLLLLQSHGRLPAPEIARRLEVSTRTVARDVEALSSAGVPVYAERGRRGGVVLMPGFRTDVSGLTDGEMRALLALAGSEDGASGALGRTLGSAVRKLLAAVPEARRSTIDRARRTVIVEQRGWRRAGAEDAAGPHHDEVLAIAEAAVADDERLRLRYRSASRPHGPGPPPWRTVDPYGLVSKAGTWYLVAAQRGSPRLFRVDRIETAARTGVPVRRPDERDLEAVWAQLRDRLELAPEAITVRVRVDPAWRGAMTRVVAPSLADPPRPVEDETGATDGTVLDLPFRAPAAAVGLLLGFGTAVEVLAPASVRAEMAERAAAVVALYRAGTGHGA